MNNFQEFFFLPKPNKREEVGGSDWEKLNTQLRYFSADITVINNFQYFQLDSNFLAYTDMNTIQLF